MKKTFVYIILVLLLFNIFSSCKSRNSASQTVTSADENEFSTLLEYCESYASKQYNSVGKLDYYLLTWTDTDSNQTGDVDFSLQIYQNQTMQITGISMFSYNSGIRNEAIYSVKFKYGTEVNNILSYEVKFEMISRRLQDAYNYYPFILDEYRTSDTKAKYNLKTKKASCNFETNYSKEGIISVDNPNETLKDISEDCFNQIQSYLSNRLNISFF